MLIKIDSNSSINWVNLIVVDKESSVITNPEMISAKSILNNTLIIWLMSIDSDPPKSSSKLINPLNSLIGNATLIFSYSR